MAGGILVAPDMGTVGADDGDHRRECRGVVRRRVPQVDANSTAFGRVTKVDRDCADFSTQVGAQEFFQSQGSGDPHGLDPDGDGRACGPQR